MLRNYIGKKSITIVCCLRSLNICFVRKKKKKKTVWAKLLGEMENDVWFFWPQTLLIEDPLLIVKRPNNISFSYVQ